MTRPTSSSNEDADSLGDPNIVQGPPLAGPATFRNNTGKVDRTGVERREVPGGVPAREEASDSPFYFSEIIGQIYPAASTPTARLKGIEASSKTSPQRGENEGINPHSPPKGH